MALNLNFIAIGFILLVIGAEWLVKGASQIAKRFHVPELLIGLTIVAIGTSMPEIFITITSAAKGSVDLIIGNAIGSNLCNLLLILGIASIIYPIKVEKEIKTFHLIVSFLATLLIMFLGNYLEVMGTASGIMLLLLFSMYFWHPVFVEIKDVLETKKEEKRLHTKQGANVFFSAIYIVLGVVLLKIGGDFVVNNAEEIAQKFNVSERIIGLTIIAIGTALPEMITSIIASVKKSADIAVGNLVGSTVLNLLLILGLGAVITPLHFSSEFNTSMILLAFTIALIWLFNFIGKKDTITRAKGFILFSMFMIYITRINYFNLTEKGKSCIIFILVD